MARVGNGGATRAGLGPIPREIPSSQQHNHAACCGSSCLLFLLTTAAAGIISLFTRKTCRQGWRQRLERMYMMKKIVILTAYLLMTASVSFAQNANFYYKLGLQSSLANKRIELFTRALALDPNYASAYEDRAIHYYFQERYDLAIQDYSRLIELQPKKAEGYRMRGVCLLKKGNLDVAIADFSQAIELDPSLASAYGSRAEAYRLKGMLQSAVSDSTIAIKLDRDERTLATAYNTRAKAYVALGRDDLSTADFNKSFDLDPRYALVRYLTGTADLQSVRKMGLIGILGIAFILIFKLALPTPRK
ncbi:MAG: tetratricopeptide repeat protein [Deltaproteobacteria bacterium]|nr:tetratricopeptide repeat protein [Deltaproteobacteria bacterium]MBW2072206.1 tetratricopeptide repeat protein [Deltaproteobacteria bacterium]